MVKLLLERGAGCGVRDTEGRTPVQVAVEEGHEELFGFWSGVGKLRFWRQRRVCMLVKSADGDFYRQYKRF